MTQAQACRQTQIKIKQMPERLETVSINLDPYSLQSSAKHAILSRIPANFQNAFHAHRKTRKQNTSGSSFSLKCNAPQKWYCWNAYILYTRSSALMHNLRYPLCRAINFMQFFQCFMHLFQCSMRQFIMLMQHDRYRRQTSADSYST